jgi:cell wall-associated NlpC family hydrolase
MSRRRSRVPKGARTAARIGKVLGAGGIGTLLIVCLVVAFTAIGSKYVSTTSGQTACELPGSTGGRGVEVFGDSTLLGLAHALPGRLAGGKVVEDVTPGRTAQQGENVLNDLPDSAPAVFVISLAEDDASSLTAYIARIDELMLLLSGRSVYWVTAPGKDPYTAIVNGENSAGPADLESAGGWHIVDFATSVKQRSDWWSGKPSSAGVKNLAQTLTSQLTAASTGIPVGPVGAGGITVTSTVDAGDSFALTGERLTNAQIIVSVGVGMGVPARGEIIAIATAILESRLVNLSGGDRDSVGLFQQRPSQGWGTPEQLHTPTYAATAFYTRLLAVPGWQDMALTDAAQAVQRSAYPGSYAQWQRSATVIVTALLGQHATGCKPQVAVPGTPKAQIAVNAALSQLGVPYSYAGGNRHGPTLGVCQPGTDGWNDCHIVGFDCSGLMLYAWATAGVTVPHDTVAMWNDPAFVHITEQGQLQPGDMMMFEGPPPGHTGIYIGNGQLVDAPHSGSVVKIESVNDTWYAQNDIGALRPKR